MSLCFDEYANDGDHGVTLYYNGEVIWEERATCGNREGCPPVSYFEDSQWHDVELTITPTTDRHHRGQATLAFTLDGESYGGSGRVNASYSLPNTTYLGFTARTGGSTNNHWVRAIRRVQQGQEQQIGFDLFTTRGSARVGGSARLTRKGA